MKLLSATDLSFEYSGSERDPFMLRSVSIDIEEGSFVSIIGRNGSGKSTLVRLLANQFTSYGGDVKIGGRNIADFSAKDLAKRVAYLPQNVSVVNESIEVRELVLLGRFSHKGTFEFSYNRDDLRVAEECIDQLSLGDLAGKKFAELSGGQKQKVLIALTLAQLDITSDLKGKLLLVDEPLTFLDVSHQYDVFNLLKKFNERGLAILAVVHDLNIALRFTDHCILMNDGQVVKFGETRSVITEEMLKEHFLIESKITEYEKNFFINYLT
jgi:iron complex transport system ATP-binding protein